MTASSGPGGGSAGGGRTASGTGSPGGSGCWATAAASGPTARSSGNSPRQTLRPTDRRYKKLAASLREFGLVEPLVWNEATGHVVGGHARLSILKEMGVTEVPVSVVRLTPEREKALNVVLNNLEAQGRYDPDKLADLLTELADLPELELTGFDSRDLAALT